MLDARMAAVYRLPPSTDRQHGHQRRAQAVEASPRSFVARGARVKPLRVSHAFHSPLIEPVLDAFEREVASVSFEAPRVALVSNLTGWPGRPRRDRAAPLLARTHMREPVRFAESIRALAAQGITHFSRSVRIRCCSAWAPSASQDGQWLPSLREGQSAWSTLLESLQRCTAAASTSTGARSIAARADAACALPTYPFAGKRHWIDIVGAPQSPPISAAARWARLTDCPGPPGRARPARSERGSYPAKWDCLARLTVAPTPSQTLREVGLFRRRAERHSLDSVMSTAGSARPIGT